MANTANLGLPLIDDNMVADVSRDVNALASGIDAKAGAVSGLATLGADGKVPAGQLSVQAPPDASTTTKGLVKLNDATNSTSTTEAATANAVKKAYDRAEAAFTQANDGKGKVRTAIIGAKGTVAGATPTFDQLVAGVATILPGATADAVLDPSMLVTGYSGYDDGVKKAGQMPNRSAANEHQPGLEVTVWPGDRLFIKPPLGYFNGSTWVTAAVPGLTAANLRQGVNVAGIIGTLIEGRQFASGSANGIYDPVDSTLPYKLTVSGLAFTPRIVIVYGKPVGSAMALCSVDNPTYNSFVDSYGVMKDNVISLAYGYFICRLKNNLSYNWIAIS